MELTTTTILVGQQRRHVDKSMDVVRPAVQQEDRRPGRWLILGVANIEDPGIDLLE